MNARTEPVRTVATAAERLGFSTIWVPEHVVLLDQYASKYPYSAGEFPVATDTPIADPFTTLAYAAACTSKIRLATGICLVPEHNPLVLAKTVATVDRLSGGRFILGPFSRARPGGSANRRSRSRRSRPTWRIATTEFVRPQADATLEQLFASGVFGDHEDVRKLPGIGGQKCRRNTAETGRKRVSA